MEVELAVQFLLSGVGDLHFVGHAFETFEQCASATKDNWEEVDIIPLY